MSTEAVTTEGTGGVWVFYPGRRLPPEQPPPARPKHCPRCGAGPVGYRDRYASSETSYSYECPECLDPTSTPVGPTRWKEAR